MVCYGVMIAITHAKTEIGLPAPQLLKSTDIEVIVAIFRDDTIYLLIPLKLFIT